MNLLRDLVFGFRQIRRHPLISLLIIMTLAIGIGPNVAIFSVLKALLLEPLPYPDPNRLVQVWETPVGGRGTQPFAYQNFVDIREQSECFEAFGLQHPRSFNLGGEAPERVTGVSATSDAMTLWNVPPAHGRLFSEDEVESGLKLVVLSHSLWQRRFGSDPAVLGQSVRINSTPYEIIGIMPASFEYYTAWTEGRDIELWTPFTVLPGATRGWHWALAVARLNEGVSWRQAEAEIRSIASRLQSEYPTTNARSQVWIKPFVVEVVDGVAVHLLILMTAVGFVLLTACANVASMLLARSADRRTEVAVRGCIGATWRRLAAQFLTESALLSFLGGVAGMVLAVWSIDLIRAFIPPEAPRVQGITIDAGVLFFALVLTALTGIVFGLAPALTAIRTDVASVVREGSNTVTLDRRRHTLLRFLAITQIAVAFMLATGAILLFTSYKNVLHGEYAFDTEQVLTSRIALDSPRHETDEHKLLFWRELIERLETFPGVERAAVTTKLPLEGGTNREILIEGESFNPQTRRRLVEQSWVSPGYFEAMGIPLLAGRIFEEQEGTHEQRAVVVNQALADRCWPGEDALGQVLFPNSANSDWTATVVGVVASVPQWGPAQRPLPEIYAPFHIQPNGDSHLIVRSEQQPSTLVAMIQKQVLEIDDDLPLAQARTMAQVLAEATRARHFVATLVSLFAVIAVLLAMTGIFGTMSHKVARRTREIGIRAAFGAPRSRILVMVLREGMTLTAIGIGVGIGLLSFFALVLRSQLYGIGTVSILYVFLIGLVVTATTFIATLLPALRASRIDPMNALRI